MDFIGYLILALVICGVACFLAGMLPLALKYYDSRTMKRLSDRLERPRSSTALNRR